MLLSKGGPKRTSMKFSKWVNKTLLPNSTLHPVFPRCVSVKTAHKWLHEMGFEVFTARKGIFIDGHDVVESQKVSWKMGFLHFTNAPRRQARQALPENVDPPIQEQRENVFFFN